MTFAIRLRHGQCWTPWPWRTISRSNFSNVNISKTVRAGAKLQEMTFVDCNICSRMASLRMLYSLILTYFSRLNFKCQYLENGESYRKTARGDIYSFQNLPSISIIANVVLFDLDLGQIFQMSISRKRWELARNCEMAFVDFNICYRMASLVVRGYI